MNDGIIFKKDIEKVEGKFALSNDFVRMPNSLTINALQILGMALSKIDFTKDYGQTIKVKFTFKELQEATGSKSNNLEFYKRSLNELQNKAILKIDHGTYYRKTVLFPEVELDNGVVELVFYNEVNQYIQKLAQNFTIYKIANTHNFTSRYAYILYCNLWSWMNHDINREVSYDERQRYYTTKQLKNMFDLPIKAYTEVKNGKPHFKRQLFEKYVIQKAVDEINQFSNLRVDWSKVKNGKRVEKYVFNYLRTDGYNQHLDIFNQ